jgi:hypothetical protein
MIVIGNVAFQAINHWESNQENVVLFGVLIHNCGNCAGVDLMLFGFGVGIRVAL